MPREGPAVGVPARRVALLVEIGEPVELGVAVRVILVHDMDLHLAEASGELHLLPRRHLLAGEDEHLPLEEGGTDGVESFIRNPGAKVEPGNFGAQPPGDGSEVEVGSSRRRRGVQGVRPPSRRMNATLLSSCQET